LIDIDGDGRQDIIMALAIGMDIEMRELTRSKSKVFCEDRGTLFIRTYRARLTF
jgi:hypothetical protein